MSIRSKPGASAARSGRERRQSDRFGSEEGLMVSIRMIGETSFFDALIEDVSRTGVQLLVPSECLESKATQIELVLGQRVVLLNLIRLQEHSLQSGVVKCAARVTHDAIDLTQFLGSEMRDFSSLEDNAEESS